MALGVTSLLMYRRVSEVEKELARLRTEAGYLKIEDETLFQAIAIPCEDPLTWKWRCYLPKGSKYCWNSGSGMVPATGVGGANASGREIKPRAEGFQGVITVSLRKDPDPHFNRWIFCTKWRSEGAGEMSSTSSSIPDELMDQILQAQMTESQCLGELKPETRKPGETIVLLKRRIGEQTSANRWTGSSKPQPGFCVWLSEDNSEQRK